MSSPGRGIHYIVQVPTSEYGFGKRDVISLTDSFPASPLLRDTPSAGVGLGVRLTNENIVAQANRFLEGKVEGNDLFESAVDLRYHHPDGPTNLQPPNLDGPDQVGTDNTDKPVFMWAPNIASPGPENGLNPLAQPESGIDAAKRLTDGQGGAFNAPDSGINPKLTSRKISTGLKIGTLNFGKGSSGGGSTP